MAKFADTPTYKRNATWDPDRKQLTIHRAPTRKQLEFLRDLHRQLGIEWSRPKTRDEAASMIDRLLAARKRRRRTS